MTNHQKVNELVSLIEERSKIDGEVQWPFVTGWLSGVLKDILDGETTIEKEIEMARKNKP